MAVLFARLTMRDGLSFAEACSAMPTNHNCTLSTDALSRLHGTLHARPKRRFVTLDAATRGVIAQASSDQVEREESTAVARQLRSAVATAVASLTIEERRMLDLRFRRGFEIVAIARLMNANQKRLYSRFDRLMRRLRTRLESAGVTKAAIVELLGRQDVEVDWWDAVRPLIERAGVERPREVRTRPRRVAIENARVAR